MNIILNNQNFIDVGFVPYKHYTVMNSLYLDIGRNRFLTVGCVGTPNENMFICSKESELDEAYCDLVCIHNYDYDGYITQEKLNDIINLFGIKNE